MFQVKITELTSNHVWYKQVNNTTHVSNVLMGGKYEWQVRTANNGSVFSAPIKMDAPPIMPPYEVRVIPESNGSFIVFWQEKPLSKEVGNYTYEVLVSQGTVMDESRSESFFVKNPPFIYTNSSSNVYTFAVRIKTDKGIRGLSSDHISKLNLYAPPSGSSSTAVIAVSVIVVLVLVGIIAGLVVRNRRLHSTFTRFANSHYDTRSQAATFDDNGLDDEDCPQIRDRFSDDEPLVIA